MFRNIIIVSGLSLLTACATVNGPVPTTPIDQPPKTARQLAKNAIRTQLKNPFDVREVKISNPTTIVYDYNQRPFWTVCVSLYARNGFNAYNRGEYYVAFLGGAPIKVVSINDYGFISSQAGKCGTMHATSWP